MMPSTHLIEIVQDLTNGKSKISPKLLANCHITAKVCRLPFDPSSFALRMTAGCRQSGIGNVTPLKGRSPG